ncbi:hypothetical protein [Aromatoleum buckelii]|uniref:Rhodanese domain-containing protein n=1 Tax=Aromatoleum buckelii TaxID=200254 RepID=A0ABX1MZ46_9RHOO|nr:hypothetical protein [Aromatoleum buckelii]MCK0512994.1 hypothetical protein [Aromatoleum buckelii]
MRAKFIVHALIVATFIGVTAHAQAAASLRNETQLKLALRASPPCCVIDARSNTQRQSRAIAEALVYREGIRIDPTASVVVVADDDDRALSVAEKIAAAHLGKTVFAVEGGVDAWERVLSDLSAEPPGGRAVQFVIPKNTCEQGPALQQLRTAPK